MGKFIDSLGEQAAGAAGGIAGTVLGLAMEQHNDRRQIRQQRKLSDMEYEYNQKMADANYQRELKMWEATNYSAQMAQLQKAGLNPALLYGMGGAGGATTGGGAPTMSGGGKAPAGGGEVIAMQQSALQMGILAAQKANIEAQTDKTKAETVNIPKTGAQIEAQTESLLTGITETKQRTALLKVEEILKRLEVTYQGETLDDRIDQVVYQTKRAYTELENAQNITYINKATRDNQIKIVENQAIQGLLTQYLTTAQTAATKQGIKESQSKIEVNKATIAKMAQDVAMGWEGLSQNEERIAIEKFKAEFEANYPGIMDSIGKGFDDGIQSLFDLFKAKRPQHRTIK